MFRHNLRAYFAIPILKRDLSPELPAQVRELADLLCACLEARYTRFLSSVAVAERVRAAVREDFVQSMNCDMTPSYKAPLPPSEFRALKRTVQKDFDKLRWKEPPMLFGIADRWDAMSAQEQDDYIAAHAQELSHRLVLYLAPVKNMIEEGYAKHAMKARFPQIDWDKCERLGFSPEEIAAQQDLQKRAFEETVILQKRQMDKWNAEWQKKVEEMQRLSAPPGKPTTPSVSHEPD